MSIIAIIDRFTPTFFLPVLEKMQSSQLARRLTSGAFWSLVGALISRGLNFLAFILVARYLGKVSFGELGIIQSTAAMFQVLAIFGVAGTVTKFVAEFRKIDTAKTGRIIALSSLFSLITGTVMGTLFFFAAPWLSDNVLNRPELTPALKISSAMLFFAAWMGAQTGALAGFEAFKKISLVNLIAGLISFPLILGGAYVGNLLGAVWGMSLAMGFNAFLNSLALIKERKKWAIPFNIKGVKNELKIIWQFSFPFMLAGLLWAPVIWTANAILVNQNDGYAEMGLFNAAHQWFLLGLFVPNIIGKAIFPVMAERIGARDYSAVKAIIFNGVKYTFLILGGFSIPLAIFSKNIMALYGPNFVIGWPVLMILGFSATFAGSQSMMGNAILAINKVWFHLIFNLIWGILYITFAYLFINNGFGADGLAISSLLSYIIKFVCSTTVLFYFFDKLTR